MVLSEEVKNKIIEILDSEEFKNNLYVDEQGNTLDKDKRSRLGMFYTPGKVCIRMIEKYECDTLVGRTILDPTCGSGNLLIACLIAGADSDKVFGNEYDADIIPTCRYRIKRALELLNRDTSEFRDWQIHQGNALQKMCLTEFSEEYITGGTSGCHYNPKYINDLEYAQKGNCWRLENEAAKKRYDKKIATEQNKNSEPSLWNFLNR